MDRFEMVAPDTDLRQPWEKLCHLLLGVQAAKIAQDSLARKQEERAQANYPNILRLVKRTIIDEARRKLEISRGVGEVIATLDKIELNRFAMF